MNLYEQIEVAVSSPLDRQRLVLGAVGRLCDRLDADDAVASKDYVTSANIAALKAAMDPIGSRPMAVVAGALFRLADKIVGDELQIQDYRDRLMGGYGLLDTPYEDAQTQAILGLLDILCDALDADDDTSLAYRSFVFQHA